MTTITIKELHARTGAHVRRAGKSPIRVTDRGKLVAILTTPATAALRKRKRTLLPEYAAFLAKAPAGRVLDDLDEIRGER